MYESEIEKLTIELIEHLGYTYVSPETLETERQNLSDIVLVQRLKSAIERLNPTLPQTCKDQAHKKVLSTVTQNLLENNEAFHKMLVEGVPTEFFQEGVDRGKSVQIIDYENITNNELIVTNQYTVIENNHNKRPDVVILINGIPILVIELKNAVDENATMECAYNQLQTYKKVIPSLFTYNTIVIASDGLDAKSGTITSELSRFSAWKSIDGVRYDSATTPQIETMVKGMLRPDVLLDLIRNFIVFERSERQDPQTGQKIISKEKKVAQYHQYYAVNKAVESTIRATAQTESFLKDAPQNFYLPSVTDQPKGDHKAGVMWHTQGSGKSLSMVFYTGKVVQQLNNPTVVVVTDRNDLDGQLFETFANCKNILRQEPIQATSITHLKELLKREAGGIIFTTIQKFEPEAGKDVFELLSNRSNIVVVADEAHRSQYGFGGKAIVDEKSQNVLMKYGHAKYIRDAIPSATFIGFTGTPIEKVDASTPAVFGNYIDVYDIQQAVADGATVPIYYTSRLAKLHLKDDQIAQLDQEIDEVTEGLEFEAQARAKWAQLEAIVGHTERLKVVAKDIVEHFEERNSAIKGKGMIVCMSRKIAVDLYAEIVKLRPEWHNDDLRKGKLKVVMTSSSSDPIEFQPHHTNKTERKELGDRFKNASDELQLVIVRDMWLTGFDVPCLHTMYIDKPMKEHNLMQAIARVNRVYKDKPAGLIVDYIGIASDLKAALSIYTESGGKGKPTLNQEEAVAEFLSRLEIVSRMFNGFDYERYFDADIRGRLSILLEAQEHILSGKDKQTDEFITQVVALSKAFSIAVPHEYALNHKDEVAVFQAIKARIVKLRGIGEEGKKSPREIEMAIKQIVEGAIVTDKVVDIFDAAGIKRPDVSILSDEFMNEVRNMTHKNLALELLKKLLSDEIKFKQRVNIIQSQKFSELLKGVINRYNNLITTVEVIDELMNIARQMREGDSKQVELGLKEDELAFYDALSQNESALQVLGDKQLAFIAREVLQKVRENTSIDWKIKESVRAKLRLAVKSVLNRYGYPPDMQQLAVDNVIKQAEIMGEDTATE
ncbi:DEAD/DEAH box helicase [Candidatus Dojkabacteria bacterium CG_4_9_14_3_um_filter_150_Dojkabacteria_WS6_41_13]|uniref:Type I restriction enzyme endonuclease subunit n=1 Tax=Candidatus Dojkabacteria bacterium CG_4_10_14_0_2_um_filter_Dojkabacteria_WS6_41_15 TaxID=2014249 RepID=A0A2M7W2A4_9BACT|nr:MAG: DEAD/DEAH box helicase [Candidatus Dojkabacteria bacterium CG_4_10_14_0_2_um_filter_Dojkabacteria_WS6_41_15]PJB23220.1 MAG: DEAD/DEAH box helicase [Candidatus Dojkabacteria bacterium CG_4_9_14_3_um_filter_150_Dojkabacteria_WS6_41_13]